jgi:hypothetical protein
MTGSADIMRDVKLCNSCAHQTFEERDARGRFVRYHPCGMFRDGRRLRDARSVCQGTMWQPKP